MYVGQSYVAVVARNQPPAVLPRIALAVSPTTAPLPPPFPPCCSQIVYLFKQKLKIKLSKFKIQLFANKPRNCNFVAATRNATAFLSMLTGEVYYDTCSAI